MSESGPVALAVALLSDEFELVEHPQVAGVPFEFDAMLIGRESLDLIVIVDLEIDSDSSSVRRRIEGLARALDLAGSLRSLTVIFVGLLPDQTLIQATTPVARVLVAGNPAEADGRSLRDALAVLLPLELQVDEGYGGSTDWEEDRKTIIENNPAEAGPILAVAGDGPRAVGQALRTLLSQPIESLDETGDDSNDPS